MKLIPPDSRDGIFSRRLALVMLAIALIPPLLYGNAPSWWSQRGVLVQNASADDYAAANQGQLKNIAKAAVAEMDAKLEGGAGDALHNLVNSWSPPSPQANDFAPLNLGQLKKVAKPFYDRLISVGLAADYPWVGAAEPANDFAVANVGQVKNLFSFDLTSIYDSDRNGLSDAWEREHFGTIGVNPSADADGDGFTNLQEFLSGTDPNDYFNGVLPVLEIVVGDNQINDPGTFLALPLTVRVQKPSGVPLINAPVTFAVTQGGGLLASSPTGNQSMTLDMRTGTDGLASVFYRQSTGAGIVSRISASASSGGNNTALSFTATSSSISPTLTVVPERLEEIVNAGQTVSRTVTATNNSADTRQLTVIARDSDVTNLIYSDSDQANGPQFIWNDISATGTHLATVSNADDNFQAFGIGFEFPYFGENYHTIYVSSNGFITFGPGSINFRTYFLPNFSAPANMIAAFESDLDLRLSGDAYYQDNGDHVIIQFDHVTHAGGEGLFTFQIVLKRDGSILFYYKEMAGVVDGATVGIQDSTREKGLTIAYRQAYLKDNLAVRITTSTEWLKVSRVSASVPPGQSANFAVTLDARELTAGGFHGSLELTTDRPADPTVVVPVTMSLNDDTYLDSDHDGLTNGEERALGTDPNSADTDGDGMPDGWETSHYLDPLTNDAAGDPDGDGLSNLDEFDAGTDPFNSDSDWDGLTDGEEVLRYHTNPNLADTDGDGMPDAYEVENGLDPLINDSAADLDGDGLSNGQEFAFGTDPSNPDTDGDGMPDGWEIQYGLNPWWNDTGDDLDGDGQTNLQEFQSGSDPSDFFNGMPPVITIVQGGNQSGTAGNYNYSPITVEVRNSAGVLLANAPVTYTITQGSGTLSLSQTANPPANVNSLSLRTDANGRASAYFMSTGAVGSTYQVAVNANTGSGGSGGGTPGPVAAGANLDPNGNEDGDEKTNDEEGKLGTNPTGFTLFAETHYSGHVETPHTENDPLPWVFYTESLTAAPAEWAGMTLKAAVVFDSVGTQNNWVVDDYASINGQQFVKLGRELIYNISDKWNGTGSNTFTATSDVRGGVFCAAYKIILSVEPSVEFNVNNYSSAITPGGIQYADIDVSPTRISQDGSGADAVFVGKPIGVGAETFRLNAGVTLHCPTQLSAADLNRICAKWKLKVIQNLVENGTYSIGYQQHIRIFDVSPVPGFDAGDNLPVVRQFVTAEEMLSIDAADSPGESFRPTWFDITNKTDSLVNITRSNTFVTWLLAENETSGEQVFLRWVKWRVNMNVDFVVSSLNFSAIPRTWQFEKIAEGDGPGPTNPTTTPFNVTEH